MCHLAYVSGLSLLRSEELAETEHVDEIKQHVDEIKQHEQAEQPVLEKPEKVSSTIRPRARGGKR